MKLVHMALGGAFLGLVIIGTFAGIVLAAHDTAIMLSKALR